MLFFHSHRWIINQLPAVYVRANYCGVYNVKPSTKLDLVPFSASWKATNLFRSSRLYVRSFSWPELSKMNKNKKKLRKSNESAKMTCLKNNVLYNHLGWRGASGAPGGLPADQCNVCIGCVMVKWCYCISDGKIPLSACREIHCVSCGAGADLFGAHDSTAASEPQAAAAAAAAAVPEETSATATGAPLVLATFEEPGPFGCCADVAACS